MWPIICDLDLIQNSRQSFPPHQQLAMVWDGQRELWYFRIVGFVWNNKTNISIFFSDSVYNADTKGLRKSSPKTKWMFPTLRRLTAMLKMVSKPWKYKRQVRRAIYWPGKAKFITAGLISCYSQSRVLARILKMPVQKSNLKISAHPDLAIQLPQILSPTIFNNLLCQKRAINTSAMS